ncbi:MAG: FRG domain-containing protein [Phycisphaeraceae bacterium]|nr:FRG domain-containing protein [Phycisphaeraceae bacterium]MCW5762225.1 FRG domain-containing protein [Phycisphaeraceae bacterium]
MRRFAGRCATQGASCRQAYSASDVSLLKHFQDQTSALASSSEREYIKGGIWNLMAIGRHSGLPTRAVDWARSPWVAAYFACMKRRDSEGSIWWFNQQQLEDVPVVAPAFGGRVGERDDRLVVPGAGAVSGCLGQFGRCVSGHQERLPQSCAVYTARISALSRSALRWRVSESPRFGDT